MAFFDDVIAEPNLLVYYRFNEPDKTGGLVDHGPNGYNGGYTGSNTIFGVPGLITGDADTCVELQGNTIYALQSGLLTTFPNRDFTLHLRLEDVSAAPNTINVFYDTYNAGAKGLNFYWNRANGSARLQINHSTTDVIFDLPVGALPAGGRYSLVIKVDAATRTPEVFIDGIAAVPSQIISGVGSFLSQTYTAFELTGTDLRVDELFIVEELLSPAKILAYHEAADPPVIPRAGFTLEQRMVVGSGLNGLTLEHRMVAGSGTAGTLLEQQLYERGLLGLTLDQQIVVLSGTAGLTLEQVGFARSQTQLTISQQITSTASSQHWGLAVMLAGVDVSASLTGRVEIDAEESAAMIAEFELEPAFGPVALTDWLGAPVIIDYIEKDGAGTELWRERLFNGQVDLPDFDPASGLTQFRCTDGLQQRFDNMEREQISALLPGHWSSAVFGDESEGWQYAKQRLKTLEQSYDIEPSGVGVLTAWPAKPTADQVFDESQFFDESLRVRLAQRRDLINRITVDFDYRFERFKQREQRYRWVYPFSFEAYYNRSSTLPNKQMVADALTASGQVLVDGAVWTLLPRAGTYFFNNQVVYWAISESLRQQLLQGADFRGALRYSQAITEHYSLAVFANQSELLLGPIERGQQHHMSARDERDWRLDSLYQPPPASLDHNGDHFEDGTDDPETGRAAMTTAVETLLALARVEILRSHRQNRVSWQSPLQPQIRRSQTLEVSSPRVKARGKLYQYIHRFDFDTGAAETSVVITVSQAQAAGALGNAAITAPAVPDSLIPVSPDNPALDIIELGTWLGGDSASPVFDDQWRGYVGNYSLETPGSQGYATQLTLESPEIKEQPRDEWAVEGSQEYHVDIPHEYLVLEL